MIKMSLKLKIKKLESLLMVYLMFLKFKDLITYIFYKKVYLNFGHDNANE